VDRLLEENPFPVPEALIEAEMERMLHNMETRLKLQGMKLVNPESYRENFRESALRNIQTELILEKIKELEAVEVSEEEVDKEIKLAAAGLKQSEEAIRKEMGEGLRNQLGRRKTLELLVKKSKIQEDIIDPEEPSEEKVEEELVS